MESQVQHALRVSMGRCSVHSALNLVSVCCQLPASGLEGPFSRVLLCIAQRNAQHARSASAWAGPLLDRARCGCRGVSTQSLCCIRTVSLPEGWLLNAVCLLYKTALCFWGLALS